MLATCVLNGWDPGTYLDVDHPLQKGIRETFEELTGESAYVAVDGCGAPLLSTSLVGLATAFRRLALGVNGHGEPDEGAARIASAIREHPEMVSGTRRDERALLTAIPGAIGKAGAESCYVVALPDGRAFAVKTDDGAARARPVVMAAALVRAGVDQEAGVDGAAVRRTGESVLLGGGRPVGEIRACF
jgi:L-asparaginase II